MSTVELHLQTDKPVLSLSVAARAHVLTYLRQQTHARGIRLAVKKTGCSGLAYVVDYVSEVKTDDLLLPLDNHYSMCIDRLSYPYLKGVHVDYVQQGLNFKFVFTNPNQTGQCGCGESFTVLE